VVLDGALAGDFSVAGAAPVRPLPTWRRALPWFVYSILVTALGALWLSTRPAKQVVMRSSLGIPESQAIALSATPFPIMDISADGTKIVFVGQHESKQQLFLRHMHQLDVTPLANTEDAYCPFFSPDGEGIAFFQKGKLRKISVLGGPATTICDAANLRGGSWGADGTIVFAPDRNSGICRVPAAGGEPVKLTDAGTGGGMGPTHRWPQLLPDGKTVLFTASTSSSKYTDANVVALSLETLKEKELIHGGNFARYVSTGHIVYARSAILMAVPFDAEKLKVTGSPVPILEGVAGSESSGSAQYAFSQSGTLLYLPGSASGNDRLLIWIDREGKESSISQHKREYMMGARVAPDATRVAAVLLDKGNPDIWVLEIERDMFTRLTVDEAADRNPVWSPDGKWIVFGSERGKSIQNLFRQLADGTGEAERLTTGDNFQTPSSFSPDGSILVFVENNPKTEGDIMYLRLDGEERKPEVFLATPFNERGPALSPDGKWVGYASNESGEFEIYVRPFLRPGAKGKVSAGQAFGPKWSPDGKEIFYRDEGKIMAVSVSVQDDTFRAQTPRLLFELKGGGYSFPFDVSPDGNRFLFYRTAGEAKEQSQQPTVVVNWFEELMAKVPPPR